MILRKICFVRLADEVFSFYDAKWELLIAINIWKRYQWFIGQTKDAKHKWGISGIKRAGMSCLKQRIFNLETITELCLKWYRVFGFELMKRQKIKRPRCIWSMKLEAILPLYTLWLIISSWTIWDWNNFNFSNLTFSSFPSSALPCCKIGR